MKADRQYPEIERVGIAEARRRVASGSAVFVDARRPDAYAAGHLPGALCAPARSVIARTHTLPRTSDPIFY